VTICSSVVMSKNIHISCCKTYFLSIPVAARSKAVRFAGIVGSNPAWGVDVCLLCVMCCQVGLVTMVWVVSRFRLKVETSSTRSQKSINND